MDTLLSMKVFRQVVEAGSFVAALQHEGESISFAVDGIEKGSLGMLTAVVGLPQ